MRSALFTVLGCLAGIILAAVLVYLSGIAVDALGIKTYDSESDQQRNFNLALVFTLVVGVLGAWLGYRFGKRDA